MSMPTKPGSVVIKNEELPDIRDIARSRDQINILYLYYYNDHGHQTCQGGYI